MDRVEKLVHAESEKIQDVNPQVEKVNKDQVPMKKEQRDYIIGKLDHVDMSTIQGAKKIVYGLISVSSVPTVVLFDPRASRSFVSRRYAEEHRMEMLPRPKPIVINTLEGEMIADYICSLVDLEIKGINFKAKLNVLEWKGLEIILGNDWLNSHHGKIKKDQCSVCLTTPSREIIEYMGIQPLPKKDEINPKGSASHKVFGMLNQCSCCEYYGRPCFNCKQNQEEDDVNKKRKMTSQDPLENNVHVSSTALTPPAVGIPQKDVESKKKATPSTLSYPHEVCIDGWTITYTEFQPQRTKQVKKKTKKRKMNN